MTGAPHSILVLGEPSNVWHKQLCQLLRDDGFELYRCENSAPAKLSLVERVERATFGRLFSEAEPDPISLPDFNERQSSAPTLGINLSGTTAGKLHPFPSLGWLTPILQSGEEAGTEDCLLYWQKEEHEPAHLIARGRARSFAYSWTESDRRAGSHLAFLIKDWIARLVTDASPDVATLPEPAKPRARSWLGMAKLFVETARRGLEQTFTNEQWHLLYHPSPPREATQADYHRLIPPKDRFWADPFPLQHEGITYLFAEELLFKENHGRLIALEVEGSTVVRQWSVLDFPYHSSYPHLIRHEDRLFMVPETSANKSVDLYECTKFPDQWERRRTLLDDCDGSDSSLLHHQGNWYLFTNIKRGADLSYCNELHLFVASDLLTGTFEPHPASPISRDCRTARMGGGFFEKDGALFRVTQKGNGRIYGEALNMMRVVQLSPSSYREEYFERVEPEGMDGLIGAHHMSYHDGITAMDALRRIKK